MTSKMKQILDNFYRYNSKQAVDINFGLAEDILYDALIIAPSFSPDKVISDARYKITVKGSRGSCVGYLAEKDDLKIAWIKTACGSCNMLDYLLICGELQFKKLIFIGAAGALKEEFQIGDICTPTYSIAATLANTYLKESLKDYVPFEKVFPDMKYVDEIIQSAVENHYCIRKASVFCTDSIVMEYTHLEEIKSFKTDLIEMETAAFYAIAQIMEIPAIALLVVSDNSSAGIPLVGRTEKMMEHYEYSRKKVLIELIDIIIKNG